MTRRDIPLDASQIIRALAEHDVDYVVIGGLAVQTHGHPRTTQDLDIVPGGNAENLRRLSDALAALGARSLGNFEPESVQIPSKGVLELDTDAGGVDVHFDPPGAPPYSDLRARALRLQLDYPVLVASLDDLISMKRAGGRPIDRSDIVALTDPGAENA